MNITSEFDYARNGNWSYNLFYGLDFIGSVFGNKVDTKVLLHSDRQNLKHLVLSKVCEDLKITSDEVLFV